MASLTRVISEPNALWLTNEFELLFEGPDRSSSNNWFLEMRINRRSPHSVNPLQLSARGDVDKLNEVVVNANWDESDEEDGRSNANHDQCSQYVGECIQDQTNCRRDIEVDDVGVFSESESEGKEQEAILNKIIRLAGMPSIGQVQFP